MQEITEIIKRPIGDLVPYQHNARTHSPAQVEQIAESIDEFGFNNPVLIDSDSGIIAGHGRYEAAKLLGLTEVPTICLAHLNEVQKRAYIIADNKLAENSEWDVSLLADEMLALKADGFDLGVMGFSDEDLADLLPKEPDSNSNNDRDQSDKEQGFDTEFLVVVTCADEHEQAEVYENLKEDGRNCKIMS